MPAPIALFTYRRPRHLAQVLAALRANPEASSSPLYVFADAARDAASAAAVGEVRDMIGLITGFSKVQAVFRDTNFGLARNITSGVSDVLTRHEAVIVIEDDIVVSPFFLRFMNEALAVYRDEPRVGSMSGYAYPISRAPAETYFIRGADCWGWATWRDRWRHYNPDGSALLAELRRRGLTSQFDFDGAMKFTQMLEDQIAGRNDSWAVRWHASCFLRDLLILYPGQPLATNIGTDGSGTHSVTSDDSLVSELSDRPILVGGIPIEENPEARSAIRAFLAGVQSPSPLPPSPAPKTLARRLREIFAGGPRP